MRNRVTFSGFSDPSASSTDLTTATIRCPSGLRKWVDWSHKNRPIYLFCGLIWLLISGCGSGNRPSGQPEPESGIYLNDSDPSADKSERIFTAQNLRGGTADESQVELGGTGADGMIWSVMLETFADDERGVSAETVRQGMVSELPDLADARVERSPHGSMLVYGRYEKVDDPKAQADLQRIKEMTFRGAKVFRKAILTRVADGTQESPIKTNDLRELRAKFPRIDPLYSLQVAAFVSTKESPLTLAERHRKAEAYAATLRLQQFDAYFHHDDGRQISVVTVGGFDHHAYDPLSTLFSPDVEFLLKKFPKHLVNGEEQLVPIDPRRPKSRKVPMAPKLILVPR